MDVNRTNTPGVYVEGQPDEYTRSVEGSLPMHAVTGDASFQSAAAANLLGRFGVHHIRWIMSTRPGSHGVLEDGDEVREVKKRD